ncbi:MAG: FtsX-like permease family protein [Thermoleophilaceae bacterium]
MFVFTGTAAVLSGLLAGIAPAIRSGRTDIASALKLGGAVGGQRLTHSLLLVAQAALSVVLLVGAGLFVRSLRNIRSLDLGLDAERVLVASIDLRNAGYGPEEIREFYRRALSAVGALPQVERISASRGQPFGVAHGGMLRIPGRDSMPVPPGGGPYLYAVTPGYFATLGTRLLRGRDFTDGDRAGSQQAVIVNQAIARLFWPGEEPLGRCVRVSGPDSTCAVVVGIVESGRLSSVQDEAYLFYRPLAQYLEPPEALYIRPRGELRATATAVRQRLQSLERDLPYVDVRLVQELVDPQYQAWKLGAVMFGAMGALAFLVTMVGLYSVVAYGVARRAPEFGIRMALGARADEIVRLVLSGGLRYTVAGIAIGVVIALAVAPAIASLLFQVSPRDPGIIVIVAIGLLAVATMACLVPAWRATRVDPAAALRAE